VDFREKPGKVTLVPIHYIFSNSALSHRLLPFISDEMNYERLKNSFVLGVQPKSIIEGKKISRPVRQALTRVLELIVN
ncbi:MAG: hypothetical protein WBC02_10665, partial [Candidatus Aminicenantaceae bacterium]